ncbi:MAG: ABC transporter substrate-binding protein [Dehalococcoidia bacterium]
MTTPQAAKPSGPPKRGGTVKAAYGTDPPTFDFFANTSFAMFDVLSLAYNRLVRFQTGADVDLGALTVRPDLAELPEQPDNVTYVFKLKPGVKWHNLAPVNGRELVADDVVYSFDRWRESVSKSGYAPLLKVEATDKQTVKMTLSEPSAPFLNRVASVYGFIAPKETATSLKDTVVGSGPFMLKSYQKNSSITFTRNPDYFEQGLPYLDAVEVLLINDNSARLAALSSGQAHVNPSGHSPAEAEQLKAANPKLVLEETPGLAGYLFFRADKPPFNDVRLRQAISLAVDRPAMVKALGQGKAVIEGAIPLAMKDWALTPEQMGEAGKPSRDLKRAKDLYTATGVNLRTKIFTGNTYGDNHVTATEMVKAHTKEIGIDLTIDLQEYSIYISNGYLGKFDEGIGFSTRAFFVDPDEYTYEKFHPKGVSTRATWTTRSGRSW